MRGDSPGIDQPGVRNYQGDNFALYLRDTVDRIQMPSDHIMESSRLVGIEATGYCRVADLAVRIGRARYGRYREDCHHENAKQFHIYFILAPAGCVEAQVPKRLQPSQGCWYNLDMSRVVVIRYSDPVENGHLSVQEYTPMLRSGLTRLSEGGDAAGFLKQSIPNGPVGLKTNCVARRAYATPSALCTAVGDLLEDIGLKENDIITWDRTSRELKAAGFELNAASFGRRCFGTDAHPSGYGREFYTYGEVASLVSGILTHEVGADINMPVLKDHSLAGVSCCLKNMYGAINNPNKYHDNNCDPFAAHVNMLAPIRSTFRLAVVDAVQLQYHAGPGYSPAHIVNYHGLLLGADPVAVDTIAYRLIDHYRRAAQLEPLALAGRKPTWLQTAQELGLGTAEPDAIEVVSLVIDRDSRAVEGELMP